MDNKTTYLLLLNIWIAAGCLTVSKPLRFWLILINAVAAAIRFFYSL